MKLNAWGQTAMQWVFKRWRDLVGGAAGYPEDDETQACRACRDDVPWRRGYVLFDQDGEQVGVYCLSCALRPCDPDCICEACQYGGIDRRIPAEDEPEYEAREVECSRCDGSGESKQFPVGVWRGMGRIAFAECFACLGDGTRTVYTVKE